MPLSLRPASEDDFYAWAGRLPDPQWHRCWEGVMVERDGRPVAIGVISLDFYGRLWAWSDFREKLPAVTIHRNVLDLLHEIKKRGVNFVHCYRNEDAPGSEKWLRRLGFVPAPDMSEAPPEIENAMPDIGNPAHKLVWKCTL